jgi:hypothetical protein
MLWSTIPLTSARHVHMAADRKRSSLGDGKARRLIMELFVIWE